MAEDRDLGDMIKDAVKFTVEYLTLSEFGPDMYPYMRKPPDAEKEKPAFDYTKQPRRLPKMSEECERAVENMRAMQTYHRGMDLQNAKDAIFKSREKCEEPEP